MKKSVYSIVLMDDVVEAIDEMAYSMNTSRSNLINQILAEKVSMMTPEMRMKDIFTRIEKLMNSSLQLLEQPSDSMISAKTLLKYKYKPTIKYSVELYRSFEGGVGRLRIALRTQSEQLIELIQRFFAIWKKVENKYLSEIFINGVPWASAGASFEREFYAPRQSALNDDDIANAIGTYINLIDQCIKLYFENIGSPEQAGLKIEELYKQYLKKGVMIV